MVRVVSPQESQPMQGEENVHEERWPGMDMKV